MTDASTPERAQRSRRWTGVLVLAVVLLVAVAIPQVTGTKVAGFAQVAPAPPGPPAVGDCLLQPVPPADAALNAKLIYPPVTTGSCTGRRYGEVVAIIKSKNIARGTVSDSGTQDPNISTCLNATAKYLGGPARLSLGGGWEPPSVTSSLAAGPTQQQRSAGQNWIACVEYLNPDAPGGHRADGYHGTSMHAFSTGRPPADFASCLHTAASAEPDFIDCHQPHPAELFATAIGGAATSRLLLTNTCHLLVAQYTGIPTAKDAQLTVKVNIYDRNGEPVLDSTATVSGYTAMCIAAPARGQQLTGPLMGLGDGTLPFH